MDIVHVGLVDCRYFDLGVFLSVLEGKESLWNHNVDLDYVGGT